MDEKHLNFCQHFVALKIIAMEHWESSNREFGIVECVYHDIDQWIKWNRRTNKQPIQYELLRRTVKEKQLLAK